jgi:hypothetical protein
LFIVALCAIYQLSDWKKVLILVTAFTIGHSITLALATLHIVNFRSNVIESLISVTILITAIGNLFHKEKTGRLNKTGNSQRLRYITALCFGLIHGLGFSNYLRSLLGREESIVQPLFAFNVGLEAGQLLILLLLLVIGFLFTSLLKVSRHDWNLVVSGIVIGFALTLVLKTNIFV